MISMAGVWQGGSATKFELIVCRFSCARFQLVAALKYWVLNNKMDGLEMNEDWPRATKCDPLKATKATNICESGLVPSSDFLMNCNRFPRFLECLMRWKTEQSRAWGSWDFEEGKEVPKGFWTFLRLIFDCYAFKALRQKSDRMMA